MPNLSDFRGSAGVPCEQDNFSGPSGDSVVDIFAQNAEREKREILATIATKEEDERALLVQVENEAENVARQLKLKEIELDQEAKQLSRLQDDGKLMLSRLKCL